jgi:phosphate transport system substrate-binding protein
MKNLLLPFIAVIFILSSCRQGTIDHFSAMPEHKGPVKITGAYALLPLTLTWVNEFEKNNPGASFDVVAMGSGGGLDAVLGGTTDLAMISAELPADADTQLWVTPVARMGVVLIFNSANPYMQEIINKGIKKDDLAAIFAGKDVPTWGKIYGKSSGDPIHVFIRSDKSGATDVLGKFLWLEPKEFRGTGVTGDSNMIQAVKKDPLAIGYANFIFTFNPNIQQFYPGFHVMPLDLNQDGKIEGKENFYDSVPLLQRAMWSGRYPSVLVRQLSIVSKGFPKTRQEVEFLKYVLSAGQNLVAKGGYIELHSSEIQCRLKALESTGVRE